LAGSNPAQGTTVQSERQKGNSAMERAEILDTSAAPAIDRFTLRHLGAYIAEYVWADEQDAFAAWALIQLADDPTLADYGWPSLYKAFQKRI
jgi:hypothetical protein